MAGLDYSIHRHVVYVAAAARGIFGPWPRVWGEPSCTYRSATLAGLIKEIRVVHYWMATTSAKSPRTTSVNLIQAVQATGSKLRTFAESVVRLSRSMSAAAFLFPPVLRSACSRMLRSITASVCS